MQVTLKSLVFLFFENIILLRKQVIKQKRREEAILKFTIEQSSDNNEVEINMLPKIKFEIIVSDEVWEKKTIKAIQTAAFTGNPGDGKIISYDLKSALRIRTGETDKDAIN